MKLLMKLNFNDNMNLYWGKKVIIYTNEIFVNGGDLSSATSSQR